jgi:hypothetical protein
MFTVPTLKVGMVGGFVPTAEWGWAKNEEDIVKEIENVKVELKKLEERFNQEVKFEGWDLIHNEQEVLEKSYEIQTSKVDGVLVFGCAITIPYTHAFLTYNKPLIIFAKEYSKPFYGSNLENGFLAWKFIHQNRPKSWLSIVIDNFDWLYEKINAIKVLSKLKNMKILCFGPVHQLIGGEPLGMGSYAFIRKAQEKFGVNLKFTTLDEVIEEFNRTPVDKKVEGIYKEFLDNAKKKESKDDEAIRSVKFYTLLKKRIEKENADAITVNCFQSNLIDRLGAAPCFALARLNDEGIVAGCEADPNALINMLMVSYASNRPTFIGDPIFNERVPKIINAHCLSASKLEGYNKPCMPYYASFHHESGKSLSQQTIWKKGEKITGTLLSPNLDSMVIIRGTITESRIGYYPICKSQVEFEINDVEKFWNACASHIPFIGHMVNVLGDHSKEIAEVCELAEIEPIIV